MANPDVDHGFAYNAQGEIDILYSPFYEPDWEYDESVKRYINRILYCLAGTIDLQKPKTPWLISHPPLPPPPATSPSTKVFGIIFLVVISFLIGLVFSAKA
ncbi:hypothetical protein MA16_Dca021915 [Dendrobium catenatum]|uniref:Uncharacterized protein n=1 Tax=Dendrobium catenatum TaxID=906689 RepID=A0A2I0VG41_9ASPA|nr:hypothetical protein MA16_Dca021915 [Dendrobium catenatum]